MLSAVYLKAQMKGSYSTEPHVQSGIAKSSARSKVEWMNAKIKRRESFGPFARSILSDAVSEWFDQDEDVPFMMDVFQIRRDKRA